MVKKRVGGGQEAETQSDQEELKSSKRICSTAGLSKTQSDQEELKYKRYHAKVLRLAGTQSDQEELK